ncbi:IS3 family transposase [Solitalea canadensis]|uniref:IS3 family transposase n=1 Tax=Solitalea canadensis TaxID=995 RepID=UPI0012F8225C|nr:IS3 family transposase [Solitalea canadensis]
MRSYKAGSVRGGYPVKFVANTLGYSRQYFYKHCKEQALQAAQEAAVKKLVEKERKVLSRLGGRKLHHQLRDSFQAQQIKMGRDKLFDFLRNHQLLIWPKRRYVQTTMSKHWLRKYPNLLKNRTVDQPDQVWVSDITYLKTDEGNCYLNLVTDVYSRKIMGYVVADSMEAVQMKQALQMAIKHRQTKTDGLIHHSDRGLQYCSAEYVGLASSHAITMSMTEQSDPYENALAERMNRTLKEEFGLGNRLKSKLHAKLLAEEAVNLYNNYRPHLSLQMQTPQCVYKQKSQLLMQLGSV